MNEDYIEVPIDNVIQMKYSEVGNEIKCPNCGLILHFEKLTSYHIGMRVQLKCATNFTSKNHGCSSMFIIEVDNV